jgi:2-polyprenyl-6-methoxyphenol hydroxylase-like FAD-dependent oxidoreductase
VAGVWPTNDGLTLVAVFAPVAEFPAFRADVEGRFLASLDAIADLGPRVRAARRADRIYGSGDNPNVFRAPFGPGWALAGDAGLTMDPITGLGIGHALRDADLLAQAIERGLGGRQPLDTALAGFQTARDRETKPAYDLTLDLAAFAAPRADQDILFGALARGPQRDRDRFLGTLTGAVKMGEFFAPRQLIRMVGLRGFLAMARSRGRAAA